MGRGMGGEGDGTVTAERPSTAPATPGGPKGECVCGGTAARGRGRAGGGWGVLVQGSGSGV